MHVLTYLRHVPLHPSMTTDNITCEQLWQQGVKLVFCRFLCVYDFRKTKKNKNLKRKSRKTKTEKPKSNILLFSFFVFWCGPQNKKNGPQNKKTTKSCFLVLGRLQNQKQYLNCWFCCFLIF